MRNPNGLSIEEKEAMADQLLDMEEEWKRNIRDNVRTKTEAYWRQRAEYAEQRLKVADDKLLEFGVEWRTARHSYVFTDGNPENL